MAINYPLWSKVKAGLQNVASFAIYSYYVSTGGWSKPRHARWFRESKLVALEQGPFSRYCPIMSTCGLYEDVEKTKPKEPKVGMVLGREGIPKKEHSQYVSVLCCLLYTSDAADE